MKKFIRLLVITGCFLLTACERDFDELKDSEQSHVTFSFQLDDFFADVLVYANGDFSMGAPAVLDAQHRVRISAYCYDNNGKLVDRTSMFTAIDGHPEVRFNHLYKSYEYQFVFLVDVVKYYSDDNFYEIWYQISNNNLDDFYLTSYERDENPKNNVVKKKIVRVRPDNQHINVDLYSLTHNGYLRFINTEGINRVSGAVRFYSSMFVVTDTHAGWYDEPFLIREQDGIISSLPVTACKSDNSVRFEVVTYSAAGMDTLSRNITNSDDRPFVVTIDCRNMTSSYEFY